jgi:predicted amidophosphoribosyltransferase
MPCSGDLCSACRLGLRTAPEVTVGGGLIGVAGFLHEGTARRLVHTLKYRAVTAAVEPLADAMADRVPGTTSALVPIPRARTRTFRYGVDPAVLLAEAVGRRTGLPVVRALSPRWWWRRHAGRARDERGVVTFASTGATTPHGAALVDDVLTTGATARAAAATLRGIPTLVLVATCASRVGQGVGPLGGAVAVLPSGGPTDRTTLRARKIGAFGSARPGDPGRGQARERREHE